jgi:hypothetical protein
MNDLSTVLLPVLKFLGGLAGGLAILTLGDMASEEVRARLDRLPRTLIGLAVRRLPPELRDDLGDEWNAELDHILRRAKLYPVTRIFVGTCYSVGIVWSASSVGRSLRLVRAAGFELHPVGNVEERSAGYLAKRIKEAASRLGYPPKLGDDLAEMLPPSRFRTGFSMAEAYRLSPELRAAAHDPDARRVLEMAAGSWVFPKPGEWVSGWAESPNGEDDPAK